MRPQQMVQSKPDREDHRRLLIAVAAICGLLAVLAVTGAWLISSSQRGNLAARPNELPVEGFELTREARLLAEASGRERTRGKGARLVAERDRITRRAFWLRQGVVRDRTVRASMRAVYVE